MPRGVGRPSTRTEKTATKFKNTVAGSRVLRARGLKESARRAGSGGIATRQSTQRERVKRRRK